MSGASPAASERGDASRKWLAPGSGERYERARFAGERARARDVRLVLGLLDETLGQREIDCLLDLPCGSGRLTAALAARARRYVGADISPAMLEVAARAAQDAAPCARLILGDGLALPFADRGFDVVVACRWLHHLHDEADLRLAVGELVRVSRGLVIASFWDECSLPGWRRRLGLVRSEGPRGRRATDRARIGELLTQAGAEPVAWRSALRFVSQQTFVAALVRRPVA